MGSWGVRSFENDDSADALDAAYERVHGSKYEDLMDDRNPMPFEDVQRKLANPETLVAAVEWLREEFGDDLDGWDDEARLALAGVVVRHAEAGVAIPADLRDRAVSWLESEAIEWDEATVRRLRRRKEIEMLTRGAGP